MSQARCRRFEEVLKAPLALLGVLALGLVGPLRAEEIVVPLPSSPISVDRDGEGYARFLGGRFDFAARSGEPAVPFQVVRVLLPPDADPATVRASVVATRFVELPGQWRVRPVPPRMTRDAGRGQPVWPADRRIVDGRDADIYESASAWPPSVSGPAGTGRLRKWRIAHVSVAPYRYLPAAGVLLRLADGSLVVEYERLPGGDPLLADPHARADRVGEDRVRDLVVNFDAMASAYATGRETAVARDAGAAAVAAAPSPPADVADGYVVVTTRRIVTASRELPAFVAAKRLRGFNVWVVTEEAWGGGAGEVAAENIRAWLRAHYLDLHLKYVLLVGDPRSWTAFWDARGGVVDGDVPMKMLYATNSDFPGRTPSDEYLVPSDFFYSDLTGNWDLDGNGYAGEMVVYGAPGVVLEPGDFGPGGVDPYAEVIVGRIPCYDEAADPAAVATLDRILAKVVRYESETPAEAGWRRNALLAMARSNDETPGYQLGEEIKNGVVVPTGDFGYHRVYEDDFGLVPPPEAYPISVDAVWRAWRASPFGAVLWWSHGDGHNAFSVMDLAHAAQLGERHPSFTFQASCGNSHPEFADNLSFSILKKGGIGAVGATRSCLYMGGTGPWGHDWSNAGMAYKYAERLIGGGLPAGDALQDVRVASPELSQWWENRTAFNLYGDPSLGLATTRDPLPGGRHRVRAEVFVDQSCDGVFSVGEDRWLGQVPVSLRLAGGAWEMTRTNALGRAWFRGFDLVGPARVRAELPAALEGDTLEACPGSPRTVTLRREDVSRFGTATVRFRARRVPSTGEGLRVELATAVVNGQPVDALDPVVEVEPGTRLTGYIEVVVDNRQPGSYVTPVVGTVSWGRAITGSAQGWYETLATWAPTGRSVRRLALALDAPTVPGVHHVGIFAGWMYSPAEVAAGDHPPVFGDGDDVWDMAAPQWREVVEEGRARSGPYLLPGRALRIVVRPAPVAPPEEYLEVDVSRAQVNGQSLPAEHPVYVALPGQLLGGFLEVDVDNEQRAGGSYYVTPVVGTASWGRTITGQAEGWFEALTERADKGRTRHAFRFALVAPSEPGTYHVGVFAGWMYSAREVAANDHPVAFGDGDDVWDMPLGAWDEVMDQGAAVSGPYFLPGRAIRIVVPDTRRPYIASIDFTPAAVELGEWVRATVTVRNPMPRGAWGEIGLDVDRDRLPPGGPFDHFVGGRVWMNARTDRIRFSRWIRPREVGRYARQARLRYLDRSRWRTADVWPWGHAFTVGAEPYIDAIWPLRNPLFLGQEQRVFVRVKNPDGRPRPLRVRLAVAPSPMGAPRFASPGLAAFSRPDRAVATFVNPGAPYAVGRYDVAARLVGTASQEGPMFGFEVRDHADPDITLEKSADAVAPDVKVAVDEPNGGEIWKVGGTHEVLWTRHDAGDALTVQADVVDGSAAAREVTVRLLVARSPGGAPAHQDAWTGATDPGRATTVSFRYRPATAWDGSGPKSEDFYYRLLLEKDGVLVQETPWQGPRALRKARAIVEKTSVHILYGSTLHATWQHKSPNAAVYFPDELGPVGVSYGWLLPAAYPPTTQARARVELFDADDNRVAEDVSDAWFQIQSVIVID